MLIEQVRKEYNQLRLNSAKNNRPPVPKVLFNYDNYVRTGTTNEGRSQNRD